MQETKAFLVPGVGAAPSPGQPLDSHLAVALHIASDAVIVEVVAPIRIGLEGHAVPAVGVALGQRALPGSPRSQK